jgi:type III secretion system low calcium response chaperone LcrH/SycD
MDEMENAEEYKIPKEAIERLKDPEVLKRQMKEGKTFQEIIGYSHDAMEKFYSIAHGLFQRQEYDRAADAFVFLTTLNPYVHNYWLGLGMSEQLNGGFQGALLAYAMAILTNPENPAAHYQSASCYRALNDSRNAILSFEMAARCCGTLDEFAAMRSQAESAIESLKGQ